MEQSQNNSDCRTVERIFTAEMKALNERLQVVERKTETLERDFDGHIEKLWVAVNTGFESIKKIIADHSKDDSDAMHKIEGALLARVPAWALAIMTVGGSIIGSMATYILTHFK